MSEPTAGPTIVECFWPQDAERLLAVRRAVFVREQGVAEQIEVDGHDPACRHVGAALPDGSLAGTLRISPQGKIGRLAVLPAWRGRGLGRQLMAKALMLAAAGGLEQTHLHAQVRAMAFYRKLGYQPEGEVFVEAGIPHQRMVRKEHSESR